MPALLCGSYIRCIAHSAIQPRRMNPPIVPVQVWAVRNPEDTVQKEDGGVRHSHQGIELAKQIVKYPEEIEGTAECFPYDEIQELREAFWL